METNRIGWGAGGGAFLVVAAAFLFTGQTAIGVAFLALGVVFIANVGRRKA